MRLAMTVAVLCWGIPSVLQGQAAYENHLVGDRSLGLAGAFVGLADDASAAFHNPGGLATLPGSTFAGSLWAVAFEHYAVDAGFHTDHGGRDLRDSLMRRMPFFAAGALKFGAVDEAGIKPHALGLVVAQPFREEFKFHAQSSGETTMGIPTAGRMQLRHTQTTTWFGLAYAYRVSPRFSIGITGFVTQDAMTHTESEIHGTSGERDSVAASAAGARSVDIEANSQHVLWRLGMVYDHDDRWRFGLMLQGPGVRLGGRGRVEQLRTEVDADSSRFTLGQANDLRADAPRPWEVRMGGTWFAKPTLATLDLSILGPVPDDDTFIRQVKQVTGDDIRLASGLERLVTLRSALGVEHVFGDKVPVRAGLLYERQGLSRTPGEATTFGAVSRDVIGSAVAVGYRGDNYDLSVGLSFTLRTGTGLALDRTSGRDDTVFTSTNVRTRTIVLFFSGGARAAAGLARSVFNIGD